VADTFSLEQYRALQERAGFLLRADRGRIAIRGADGKAYLQGLLSNDVLALQPGESCYATLLNAQGRMISDMRVFDLGELLMLDLASAVTPSVAAHLANFVITEDVLVEDVTSAWAQVGVYGPAARSIVTDASKIVASVPLRVLPSGDLGVEGVDIILPAGDSAALTAALERSGAVHLDAATTDVTRIEAGIPKFLVDMDTSTIPLEAGIEDRAISMTKGCYVGQEVIVRVLHRGGGRVAKKLVGLVIHGPAVSRDERVYAEEREVGRVTSVARSPRVGKQIALGYVQRDYVGARTQLQVRTPAGESSAIVVDLPFST
jgi:folate-binding protein YgfZ